MAHLRRPHHNALLPTLLLGVGVLWLVPGATIAADDPRWASCPPPSGVFAEPPPPASGKAGQTELSADEVISRMDGVSQFHGDVIVQRDGRTLQGDMAHYDAARQEVTVEGNVVFHAEQLITQGDKARLQLDADAGELSHVRFHLPAQHAFGSAEQFIIEDAEHSTLKRVRYTTCNPEQEDWVLSAKELTLDQASNTGEAYHTVFRFKGVPLFYSPYLNFPLSGRKSGLLAPGLGSSEANGSEFRQPVYWNIAPNYDATITPRYLSERGLMAMSEFRFLTEKSHGQIQADYLGNDQRYGDDRSYLAIDHQSHFAPGWRSTLTLRRASDDLYLSELGTGANDSSTSHLERRLDLRYANPHWNFLARAQGYQALTGNEPYQRLPQLKLNGQGTRRPNQLQFNLESEAVNFAHETKIPTGTRLDLKPSVTLPLEGSAWYLKPKAAVRYTDYQLNDYAAGDQFNRSLPILSLDSGLFFERETRLGNRQITQTLEPRLFYLHVPYEDQDPLPLFDTGSSNFSYSQLFRDNRFNGADRQGDANQLTTALTSRLISEADGSELLRASIGRIHYFEDRRVTLNTTDPVQTETTSDLFAELEFQPVKQLRMGLDIQYDTERDSTEQLNSRIRYQPDKKRLISLDYRYDETEQSRQSDTLLYWPVARKWQLLGRWRYDLEHAEDLDLLAGVEYESCCWSLRLMGRNQRNTINDEMESSVYLTFGFKGLGSFGERMEDVLEQGVFDYD